MKKNQQSQPNPNPNGKHGNPISLAPHTVDEVMRKMLTLPPSPKPDKPTKKKPVKTKRNATRD